MESSSQSTEGSVGVSAPGKLSANPFAGLLNKPALRLALILVIAAGIFLLYFASFQADRFGFYRDDSMYVVMGKALATGQGYRIISLPDEPLQTKSPPLYPFLLSIVWRLMPDFPQNLTAMMLLSAAITILFLCFAYKYLVGYSYAGRWQALIAVGLAAINWRTIVLATGMYSEMFYAALSIGALYLAEKYEKGRSSRVVGCALGMLIGVAFLARSAGIALLLTVAFYFLLRRQRKGVLPVAVAAILILGWVAWGYFNSITIQDTNAGSYETYFQTLRALIARDGQLSWSAFFSVIAKNALGLVLISIPVVCLGLAYESVIYFGFAFLFIAAGFFRHSRAGLRLLHIYVITYLLVHLLWPYTAYDRFLMPLLPFLLLFMLIEVEAIFALIWKVFKSQKELIGRASAAFIGLALVILGGATLYNYGLGIYRSLSLATPGKKPQPAPEDAGALDWIKINTDPSDVVICYRDPLYYLYTGRKAARSSLVRDGRFLQPSQSAAEETANTVFRIVDENKARYWISTQSDFALEYQPDIERQNIDTILEANPKAFDLVFQAADQGTRIYRINR